MKKLLLVLILMSFTLSATPKVYDWVYINKIKDLDMNNTFLSLRFQADGGMSDGTKEKVEVTGQMSDKYLSLNTSQLIQVKTYRIKTSILEMLVDLNSDLLSMDDE